MPLGQPGPPRPARLTRADQATEAPVRTTLETLFLESTVIWASATALIGEEGRLSYSDLMVRAQNVAAVLRARGMRPGDLVGVVGTRTFSAISGILGILLAGGVYVPFDVYGQSEDRLLRQLDESGIRLLVTDRSDLAGRTLPWARRVSTIDASTIEREFMPLFRELQLPRRLPEDPAVVVFNAAGRGVLVTHAAIVRLVTTGSLMEFRAADTVLLHAGAQEHAFQLELWGPLLAGGTVALAPQSAERGVAMPAREYARVMRRYHVSAICARPVLLAELAEEPLSPLDHVQQAVIDATDLEPALVHRLRGSERGMRVTGGLGAAETTSFAVSVKVTAEEFGAAEPVPGTAALVVLGNGNEAAPGALGSLAIAGDALAIGYLGQPEASRAAFPEAQRENSQRLRVFRLPVQAMRLMDGSLLTGSAAVAATATKEEPEQIVTSEQIESLLLKHPLVRECVALAPVAGGRVTCVFATLRQAQDADAERILREHLETHVPPDARPRGLILLPRLPLGPDGLPDRMRLSEQCDALLRRFSPSLPAAEASPRQADVVRSIWQRLLHRMQVDLDEDFYASGGTSVKRIRLYAELNQRFPGAITMADMRSLNTIRKIVRHLDSETARDRMLALERRGA